MEKILRTHEQILAVCYLQSYNFVKFKFNFYVIFTTNIFNFKGIKFGVLTSNYVSN